VKQTSETINNQRLFVSELSSKQQQLVEKINELEAATEAVTRLYNQVSL